MTNLPYQVHSQSRRGQWLHWLVYIYNKVCEGIVWKISNAAKNDNTGCTFSTKFPKIMLLSLNLPHFFILFCVNKTVEFFKKCLPFYDYITNSFQTSTFLWKNNQFSKLGSSIKNVPKHDRFYNHYPYPL